MNVDPPTRRCHFTTCRPFSVGATWSISPLQAGQLLVSAHGTTDIKLVLECGDIILFENAAIMDLLPVHAYRFRRVNSNANLVPFNPTDGNDDFFRDHDLFAATPC
jgi:hypothetical protein